MKDKLKPIIQLAFAIGIMITGMLLLYFINIWLM